ELVNMHPGHFRRLCRHGIFPKPKRTAKGRPYLDYELLTIIARVLKTGIGHNGEEIIFYRRKPKATKKSSIRSKPCTLFDPYLDDLAKCLLQLGIPRTALSPKILNVALTAEFGPARPSLEQAIPRILRRINGQ
ncbi:MAG: hypothetical protein GXY44_16485, partial [Phycisphaerales bacterium]|nr:hypothetical protein [Phycisphaerales bacterium]